MRWWLNSAYRKGPEDLDRRLSLFVMMGTGFAVGILFTMLLAVIVDPPARVDAFGRPHNVPDRCLALGPPAPAWNATDAQALRCTFWCDTEPSGPAACLLAPLHAVLDMHLLRIAPLPGVETCHPVRETWADGQAHLACRWGAVALLPYGLRIADDPELALAVQVAADEAARALRPLSN